MMREIEQFYSTQIEEMPMFVPSALHRIITGILIWDLGTLPTSFKHFCQIRYSLLYPGHH